MRVYLITDEYAERINGFVSEARRNGTFLISLEASRIGQKFQDDWGRWPTDAEIIDIAKDDMLLREIEVDDRT